MHALAAPPFALRAYLQERAAAGAGLSSLRLTVAALRKLQTLAGAEPSAHDQVVTDTLSGLARLAAAPRQAHALTAEALAVITATACQPRVGRGGRLESPEQARRRGLVDIALCRVLSDAGLRRAEAAALKWDDAARWDDGSGQAARGPFEDRRRGAHRLPDAGVGGGFGRDAAGRRGRVGFAVRAVRALDFAPHPRRRRGGRAGVGVSPAIRDRWAWRGAWARPARRRMRSWPRAAGKRPGWSRSIRAPKRRGGRRNGWRRGAV